MYQDGILPECANIAHTVLSIQPNKDREKTKRERERDGAKKVYAPSKHAIISFEIYLADAGLHK